MSEVKNYPFKNLIPASVKKIIDGDTLVLNYIKPGTNKAQDYTVRLLLINTPELDSTTSDAQEFAQTAKQFLENNTNESSPIYIEYDKSKDTDVYGRELAYLWSDETLMNEKLLENGLARVDFAWLPNIKYLEDFYNAEGQAKSDGVGIWGSDKNLYQNKPSLDVPRNPNQGTTGEVNPGMRPPPNPGSFDNTNQNTYNKYGFNEAKSSPHREFFSGANVKIYFGDVWVDQLAGISFQLQENVAPIYGFRSYTFDRVSRGTRFVQGEFTLNFTENGYMQSILDKISTDMDDVISKAEEQETNRYATNLNEGQNIRNLLSIGSDDIYKENIEALKASFWGNPSSFAAPSEKKESDSFYYAERSGTVNSLKEHGFNILIDYTPDANQRDFEDCLNMTKDSKSFYQTFRSIIGVHIMSEGQAIMNNGQVIQQTFQFVARDLDGDITTPSLFYNYRNRQALTLNDPFNERLPSRMA